MTESIKMGIKLLRYTWNVKLNVGLMLLFALIGIGTAMLPVRIGGRMSSYMLLVVTMYPAQMLWSLSTANILQTSPWKRRMQTTVVVLVSAVSTFVIYLVILGIKALQLAADPAARGDIVYELLQDALVILLIMLYGGAAFKRMYTATVLFGVLFMVMSFGAQYSWLLGAFENVPLWAAVCGGFGAIIAGTVLQYGLLQLLYKYPLSKAAQSVGLRKHM